MMLPQYLGVFPHTLYTALTGTEVAPYKCALSLPTSMPALVSEAQTLIELKFTPTHSYSQAIKRCYLLGAVIVVDWWHTQIQRKEPKAAAKIPQPRPWLQTAFVLNNMQYGHEKDLSWQHTSVDLWGIWLLLVAIWMTKFCLLRYCKCWPCLLKKTKKNTHSDRQSWLGALCQ